MLTSYQWLETGVLVPEEIYFPTNSIRKDVLTTKPFIFKYIYIFHISHINNKTFSLVFTGVLVSDVYETPDKKLVCVRDWFYKIHEEQSKRIEHKFDIVNVHDWAQFYAFKNNDDILTSKCRSSYCSEIKSMENQSGVYLNK